MSSWGTGEATAAVPVGPRGLPGPAGANGAPGVSPPLATTAATVTGTDATLPVHSAGVAAAIAAQAPGVIAAWLASLPTNPTGLPSGSIYRNGELFGIVP
jgi:hypothetical protein